MRVLLSRDCYLWLSREAVLRARELGATWASSENIPLVDEPGHHAYGDDEKTQRYEDRGYSLKNTVPRHDPVLLQVFDELGSEGMVGPDHDGVETVEVPDYVHYFIGSYLGEWVAEAHRIWTLEGGECPGGGPVFNIASKFEDYT